MVSQELEELIKRNQATYKSREKKKEQNKIRRQIVISAEKEKVVAEMQQNEQFRKNVLEGHIPCPQSMMETFQNNYTECFSKNTHLEKVYQKKKQDLDEVTKKIEKLHQMQKDLSTKTHLAKEEFDKSANDLIVSQKERDTAYELNNMYDYKN